MSNNASLFKLFLMILLSAVLIGGCKKEESGAYKWGEASYYKKFLWSKSDPVVMKHTLEFEFNEYANEDVKSVKFGLYEKNDAGEFVPVSDGIILYKNGEVCDGTTFFVTPEDKAVELGIEFTPEAENGCHVWYLKVLDAGGLDCIDDQRITEEDQTPLLLEWEANYDKQANPLKVGCIIALITIVTALAVWILVLRFMLFPRFRVRRLIVDDKHIPVKGFIKVVFTAKNKKQSAIAALFTGKIKYVMDDFWSKGDIQVEPANNVRIEGNRCNGIRITIPTELRSKYSAENNRVARNSSTKVCSMEDNKSIEFVVE